MASTILPLSSQVVATSEGNALTDASFSINNYVSLTLNFFYSLKNVERVDIVDHTASVARQSFQSGLFSMPTTDSIPEAIAEHQPELSAIQIMVHTKRGNQLSLRYNIDLDSLECYILNESVLLHVCSVEDLKEQLIEFFSN